MEKLKLSRENETNIYYYLSTNILISTIFDQIK
jgi:hypothetical protein